MNIFASLLTMILEALGVLFLIYLCGVLLVKRYLTIAMKEGYIDYKGIVYKIVPADLVVKK